MKPRIKYAIIGLTLVLHGCELIFNKCGKNVFLGEFSVMSESIADWHPYRGVDQLVFTNSENEKLILKQVEDSSFLQVQTGKTICWEESWDSSSEYIHTEWIESRYEGEGHEIKVVFHVGWYRMNSTYEIDDLLDQVTYESFGEHMGGTLDLVANNRGNNIDPELLAYPSYVYADSIEINGQLFEDVWYFNREYPTDVFTPTLYVKKGIGVLGFMDDSNTVWLLED
ncbi:MAG: hypothetical protein PF450_02405 [Bacteroidales bacterium]|jgi:hypothetical protein|nr:hypothetical protein [Bacteroidales bacterium]